MDDLNLSDKLEQITSISLLEDLQSQDTKVKINAIRNLRGISLALGCDATKKELLPYLKNCVINEEEDEVLIELAKILSNFLDCIGGKQSIKDLLGLFEVILSIDEPTIRKEAINSLKETIQQIGNIKYIEKDLMDIINKFYIVDDVNQKLSALNLIMLVYKDLNDNNKKIVLDYLDNFAVNDNISIKKELLNEITKITLFVSIDYIKKFINTMLKDKNDTVKMDLLNVIISIKEHKDLLPMMDYI
jgi:serine/threonine-protein phosphatase 2A regulatory subunit A